MSNNIIQSSNINENILSIEFKNTKKNNALSLNMLDEINAILLQKNLKTKYQVIVFKGYKDSPFSSGADLNDIKSLKKSKSINTYHNKLNTVLRSLRKLKIIKVSIINDFRIGAGFIFAMNTDLCIANGKCIFYGV